MRVTVNTIARMAGVSRGTVDRVLHNRPNVRPEVRDRILAVMKELDYKPNAAASALAFSRKTRKIGVILPQWKGFFKEEISRGVEEARRELNTYGIEVLVADCPQDEPDVCIKKIDEFQVEGISGLCICAQDYPLIREKIAQLANDKIPVITFNSDIEESRRVCFVGQDLIRSGRIAAEIMVKCIPHDKQILIVVGNLKFSAHRQRLQGFFDRMAEHGQVKENFIAVESFNEYSRTFCLISESLRDNEQIRGIYMANESVAACAEAIRNLSLKVKPIVVCHDLSRSTKALLKSGEVDFALEQDMYIQARKSLQLMKDLLMESDFIVKSQEFTQINIVNAENVEF